MLQELKFQLSTAILTILTLAACVAGVLNFDQKYRFRLPDDGAVWVDRNHEVVAERVPDESPAAKAGIRTGDKLKQINGLNVREAVDVARVLVGVGALKQTTYVLERGGIRFEASHLIVSEAPMDREVIYQYVVGAAYLVIGLFVYLRRGSANH